MVGQHIDNAFAVIPCVLASAKIECEDNVESKVFGVSHVPGNDSRRRNRHSQSADCRRVHLEVKPLLGHESREPATKNDCWQRKLLQWGFISNASHLHVFSAVTSTHYYWHCHLLQQVFSALPFTKTHLAPVRNSWASAASC
jgi:hypothetical protein